MKASLIASVLTILPILISGCQAPSPISISIDYLASFSIESETFPDGNRDAWFVIADSDQAEHWTGLDWELPRVNFERYMLVVSRFEIDELLYYPKAGGNGIPPGRARFKPGSWSPGTVHCYQMPRILISNVAG